MKKEEHVFSFLPGRDVADHIGRIVGSCQTNGARVSDGVVLRALLMWAQPAPDLVELVRKRADQEKENRKARRADRVQPNEEESQPVSFQVDAEVARKARELVACCKEAGLSNVSSGLLMRALIMSMEPENNSYLTGLVRARSGIEKLRRNAKRRETFDKKRRHGTARKTTSRR